MKIMVCYDGSEVAQNTMDLAQRRARAFGGKLYLVRSLEGGYEIPKRDLDRIEQAAALYAKTVTKDTGIPCEPHVLIRGQAPGEDLVQFASENDIDLIIIGLQKRSKVGKFVFGSTAQYVILEAGCPVLTLK